MDSFLLLLFLYPKTKCECFLKMIKVLRKAFNILEILSSSDEAVSLAQIAEKADIPPSTCAGIIKELCETGFAEKDQTRGYRLGIMAKNMAERPICPAEHVQAFSIPLRELFEKYSQQAVITKFANLVRYSVAGINEDGIFSSSSTADAGALESATGLVLLSSLPTYKREYFLSFYNVPNKFRSINEFHEYLDGIIKDGFAVHSSNSRNAIAVPIRLGGEVIYSIGLSFKNKPIDDSALSSLKEAAEKIEKNLN